MSRLNFILGLGMGPVRDSCTNSQSSLFSKGDGVGTEIL